MFVNAQQLYDEPEAIQNMTSMNDRKDLYCNDRFWPHASTQEGFIEN